MEDARAASTARVGASAERKVREAIKGTAFEKGGSSVEFNADTHG